MLAAIEEPSVFTRANSLFAVPFEPDSLKLLGEPFAALPEPLVSAGAFSVSQSKRASRYG
jgi:hypothetical protein